MEAELKTFEAALKSIARQIRLLAASEEAGYGPHTRKIIRAWDRAEHLARLQPDPESAYARLAGLTAARLFANKTAQANALESWRAQLKALDERIRDKAIEARINSAR